MVTHLIKQKEVRRKFNEIFKKQNIENILTPNFLEDYNAPLVGNALDYFISCHFNYLNKNNDFIENIYEIINGFIKVEIGYLTNIEKKSLSDLEKKEKRVVHPFRTYYCYKLSNGKNSYGLQHGTKNDVKNHIRWIRKEIVYIYSGKDLIELLEDSIRKCETYKRNGKISTQYLNALLTLAQILPGIKLQRIGSSIGKPLESEIATLKKLINKIPKDFFSPANVLINPSVSFGLISGQPDYIIDDIIVDIKSTKSFFKRQDYNQLICYYLLYKIREKSWNKAGIKINKIGIYYALYGELIQFNVSELCSPNDLKEIIKLIKSKSHETSYY